MAARSIWSGSISFGLINIPVKLQSAIETTSIDFNLLSKKDMAPIKYARIDTKTGEEVPWKEVVKGYQYAKGKYVVVTDEDFEKASPAKSKSIDIIQFTKEEEIDPIYFEKPYYVLPAKGAEKTYQLLLRALDKTKTVGVAEFMLRDREHVCTIKAGDGILILNQLRYQEEIKEVPELAKPSKEKISEKEVQLAVKLIDQLTAKFNPEDYRDTYIDQLKKVIKAKAAGKQIHIAEPKTETTHDNVKDLMDVLKQSLQSHSKKRA
jgi:DNA end-binding protein Ku